MISEYYRKLNERLHYDRPTYGRSGHKWAEDAAIMAKKHKFESVLDYGCGKGTFKDAFSQYSTVPVAEYDPAIPSKAELPEPADLVVCTDVMEHVEPDHLDDVLKHLRNLANEMVVMTVATRPANKHLSDGRNAHLIICDSDWWREKIEPFFLITELIENPRDESEFICYLIPREAQEDDTI